MNYHYVTGLGPNENTISFSTVLILAGIMEPPLLKFMPTGSQQNKMTLLKGTTAVSYQASRNCTASKVIISNEAFQCTLSNVVFIPDKHIRHRERILVQRKGFIQNQTYKKNHILK